MKRFVRAALLSAIAMPMIASAYAQKPNERALKPGEEILQPVPLTKHELFSEDHTADVLAIDNVWSAYVFYNDSHNGPGVSSLFTPDAIIHFVWNDKGKLVPEFGINPHDTPEGPNGEGCVLRGRRDFATYFGYNRDVDDKPLALPYKTHHMSTNKMVKVFDDGKTAMLTTAWMTTAVDAKGESKVGGTGSYRVYLRKTDEGWEISEMYGIGDHPSTTQNCDLHGPLPRPKHD